MSENSSDFDWVVVVAGFLAFTFAFGMGANDIPNAFATTIVSETLTMKQAVVLAGVCELVGAYSMSNTVETKIKDEVINRIIFVNMTCEELGLPIPAAGESCPAGGFLLMWGLTCALAASSVWVILVTWMGWPISSTHTIISSMVVLTFVLPFTRQAISWDFKNGDDISPIYGIFLSWIVTPPAAALLSGISFTALKYFVLQPLDADRRVIRFLPVVWALTAMTITLLAFFSFPNFKNSSQYIPVLVSLLIAVFVYAIAYWFGIPHARGRLERYDNSLRRRIDEEVLELHENFTGGQEGGERGMVEEESARHSDDVDLGVSSAAVEAGEDRERLSGREGGRGEGMENIEEDGGDDQENVSVVHDQDCEVRPADGSNPYVRAIRRSNELGERRMRGGQEAREGGEEGRVWEAIVDLYCRVEMHTFGRDLVFSAATQRRQERAQRYSQRVEEVFYPLQILPACAMAFAHGANDVANQLAPFSLIYEYGTCQKLNKTGEYGMKTLIGIAMCFGFALMGYMVTRNIGGLTLMTPSRSFTCQVCAAFAVAMCSVKGVPVSTTQILIGSTIGVGAADNYRTVDWWLFGKFFLSWMATALAAGGLTALFFSVSIYSPSAVPL